MRSIAVASVLAAVAYGQATFNSTTGEFTCAIPNGVYCAGSSLTSNIIIRCSNGVGQPGNCNDNLAGVPPVGVKTSALCYQTSDTAGDGACSYNGVAYPDNGNPFTIGASSSTSTSCSTSTSTTVSTSCSTSTTLSTSCSTSTSSTPVYSASSTYTPPPYQTANSTSYSTGPTGTGYPTGTGSGPTGTGTGYPTGTGTGATWSGTSTPTITPYTGAGNALFASSPMAVLPVVGFLAYFL